MSWCCPSPSPSDSSLPPGPPPILKPRPPGEVLKLLLLGDTAVGKTCLLLRWVDECYSEMTPTIGVDFKHKKVEVNGRTITVQTAGQEKYLTMVHAFYRSAKGVLLCYDITRPDSFKNVMKWSDDLSKHGDSNVHRILIATKVDAVADRRVSTADGKRLAEQHGMQFFETSAKDNTEVNNAFMAIVQEAVAAQK